MVKWEVALGTEKLLKQSILEQMWKPYESARGKEREKHGFSQGLGWHIPNYFKHKVVTHNGGIKGFSTNITRFIDDEVIVVLLCNLESIARPDVITKGIAEHFISGLATKPLQPPV